MRRRSAVMTAWIITLAWSIPVSAQSPPQGVCVEGIDCQVVRTGAEIASCLQPTVKAPRSLRPDGRRTPGRAGAVPRRLEQRRGRVDPHRCQLELGESRRGRFWPGRVCRAGAGHRSCEYVGDQQPPAHGPDRRQGSRRRDRPWEVHSTFAVLRSARPDRMQGARLDRQPPARTHGERLSGCRADHGDLVLGLVQHERANRRIG